MKYSVLLQVTSLVEMIVEADDPSEAESLAQDDLDPDNVLEVLDATTLSVTEVDE